MCFFISVILFIFNFILSGLSKIDESINNKWIVQNNLNAINGKFMETILSDVEQLKSEKIKAKH